MCVLNAVNTSMDCIFSVAHDRWFVIRPSDSPPCPIDNSSIKIRAAGKLYDPDSKYSQENLLQSFESNCNQDEITSDNSCRDFSKSDDKLESKERGTSTENADELAAKVSILKNSTSKSEDTIDYEAKIKENLDNFRFNIMAKERFTFETRSFYPENTFAANKPTNVSFDDSLNDNGVQFDTENVSNDTLDGLEEGDFRNDIIPPPSEFASEMNPLRKSKSAPAPFQKAKRGAYPCILGMRCKF